MRSFTYIAAFAAIARAQDDSPAINPTPDALDLDFLATVPIPAPPVIQPGVLSQVIPYNSQSSIESAASAMSATPVSTFPAATSEAINDAGEGDAQPTPTATGTPARRQDTRAFVLDKRAACSPEPTISTSYNIDVSNYDNFKADPVISSVASAATVPAGYFLNFKNAGGANSAQAYLGYNVVKSGVYDVAYCAQQCSKKSGCLAFNIYFERDPTVTPGSGCEDPTAFANIKCSYWGVPLDSTTAKNVGQYRAQFHVGIAGSNAYTSYSIGGPVDGYSPSISLGNAALNAPLRDCADTWSYLGYKLYQDQPFSPPLCAAACDALTEYNLAHPPSSGVTPQCGGFGVYLTNKQSPDGAKNIVGQMCTFYTQAWGSQYAKNTGQTDGQGNVYTFSTSYFYGKPDRQPVCTAPKLMIRGMSWRGY